MNQEIEKQEQLYQIEYNKFRDMVYEEEEEKLKPYAKTFLGKCYKFENSYGSGDKWWLYLKVHNVEDTSLYCISLQKANNNTIEIKPDEYKCVWNYENPFKGYIEITKEEFEEQKENFIKEVNKF